MARKKAIKAGAIPPVYVVSGGTGSSGEQVVNTVLAQFQEIKVPVIIVGSVYVRGQIENIVAQAGQTGGTIVHTLVDERLRDTLTALAHDHNVAEVDLMGPLMHRLKLVLNREPLGRPGLYRKLHEPYFMRIAAIEYTLDHDDGQKPEEWNKADIVLVGVSRSGKTPLSVYLSVLGFKTANCPVVPKVSVPDELFGLDPERVFGLVIDPERLLKIRSQRIAPYGVSDRMHYADPATVEEELRAAGKVFRKGGFHIIDMTDKTLEACAAEIIRRMSIKQ